MGKRSKRAAGRRRAKASAAKAARTDLLGPALRAVQDDSGRQALVEQSKARR